MEIILKEYVKGLGHKNEIVNVRPGYARNFLIPKGFAIIATDSSKKVIAENLKQAAHKIEKIKNEALALASSIGNIVLEIPAKIGDSGKIFGSVTTLQLSQALKDRGFDIDRKKISFETDIKTAGDYVAVLDLHKEVKHKLAFKVIPA
jgi:large subunit ribosomal protein L9